MKLIICGLPGTGKTTIAKNIFEKHKFKIISDWDIFDKYKIKINKFENKNTVSINYSKILFDYVNNSNENYVFDFEYSISPNEFIKYSNQNDIKIVYLGFVNIDEKILFDLFKKSSTNKKYSDVELISKIKFYKDMSILFKKQCDAHNLKFFDVNKNKNELLQDVLAYLNLN